MGVLSVVGNEVLVFHAEIDGIVAGVETQIQAVFVRNLPVEFAVEIIKIIAHAQFADFRHTPRSNPKGGLDEQVAVGAAVRQVERQLVLHNRAFKVELRRNEADAGVAVVFLHVAFLHANVDHRRKTATEMRRETPFI